MTTAEPRLDPQRLTRYLLGELPADDEMEIETALLADDAAWEAARLAEDDLVDAYVLGRVDGERRARLAARVAASPRLQERVAFSRSLHALARAQPAPRRLPWRVRVRDWLAAGSGRLVLVGVAIAVLVVALVWPGGGDPQRAPLVAALVLEPATRGPSVPVVAVDGVDAVDVIAVLDPEEVVPRYRLRILGARGIVWSADGVAGTRSAVRATVPTRVLAPGAYALELTGFGADGVAVALGSRDFRVTAAPR